MSKIFIIGLPRTGTTSISVALLEQGYKVAHTAFSQASFHLAQVISDAPCFSDYAQLDTLFPDSKFVYLQRDLTQWTSSMQVLLTKMTPKLHPKTGSFNPVLKRSFEQTFTLSNPQHLTAMHLAACYEKHAQQVNDYFQGRDDLLRLDISVAGSLTSLLAFLGHTHLPTLDFPHHNKGTQVAAWKDYKHVNKINSLSAGQYQRRFFDYHFE